MYYSLYANDGKYLHDGRHLKHRCSFHRRYFSNFDEIKIANFFFHALFIDIMSYKLQRGR